MSDDRKPRNLSAGAVDPDRLKQAAAEQASARDAARFEADLAAGRLKVWPFRITMAMNMCGLEGPGVDLECGTWEKNPDGDVDAWEAGTAVPSKEQVALIADLTNFPERFFYTPPGPGERRMSGRICWGRRRASQFEDYIDEQGVLHTEWTESRPERKPRQPRQPGSAAAEPKQVALPVTPPARAPAPPAAPPANPHGVDPEKPHRPRRDPRTPSVCSICEWPIGARRHREAR
jgi:hypothetical protein